MRRFCLLAALLLAAACGPKPAGPSGGGMAYARWFDLTDSSAIFISPFDGARDTLALDRPMNRLVCLSTSYLGYLEAIGMQAAVVGVSGRDYVYDETLRRKDLPDVGYEAAPDYETLLRLHPDLVLAYTVSRAEPPYLERLRSLGLRVVLLQDHLEEHPLARAEYVRLMGALTGRREASDSAFSAVESAYQAAVRHPSTPVRVLVNLPYAGEWFIPGADNYLSRLVRDAGGAVLGAREGSAVSRIISLEEALSLSREADLWLHPGWCRNRAQLRSVTPLSEDFPALEKPVWNNTRRLSPEGGNDFWESGAARPDLVLRDLGAIFSGMARDSLYYYVEVKD